MNLTMCDRNGGVIRAGQNQVHRKSGSQVYLPRKRRVREQPRGARIVRLKRIMVEGPGDQQEARSSRSAIAKASKAYAIDWTTMFRNVERFGVVDEGVLFDSLLLPYGEVSRRHDVTREVLYIFGLQIDGGTSALSVFEHRLVQSVLTPE